MNGVLRRLRRMQVATLAEAVSWLAVFQSKARWTLHAPSGRHPLPGRLVVSLTSHAPRFRFLSQTVRNLLVQSIRPDCLILWVDARLVPELPPDLLRLTDFGLVIRGTRDVGPFTKLIPALQAYPDAFIVTADDDVCYPRRWLEHLTSAWSGNNNEICFLRGHVIRSHPDGSPLPYRAWHLEGARSGVDSAYFPTGVGGVLYPPGSLAEDVLDEAAFLELCPQADDVWFYWMAKMAGSTHRAVGKASAVVTWPRSQDKGLLQTNLYADGNDRQIRNMIDRFGLPKSPLPRGSKRRWPIR